MAGADLHQVVVQDSQTLESARELLLPHPGCPLCGGNNAAEGAPDLLEGSDEQTYERLRRLMSPNLGVLSAWTDEPVEQIPVKSGRVRLAAPGPLRSGPLDITAFDTDNIMRARIEACASAIRMYTGTFADRAGHVVGPAAWLAREGHDVVPGVDLVTWTGMRAAHRDDQLAVWAPGISLVSGRACLLPAEAVYPCRRSTTVSRSNGRRPAPPWPVHATRRSRVACAMPWPIENWSPSSGVRPRRGS